MEGPETYASVNPRARNSRSRRFLGQFCSFLVFGRPRNLRERESRGQNFTLASVSGPVLCSLNLCPETYASVNPRARSSRSRRFLGLFCCFLSHGRPNPGVKNPRSRRFLGLFCSFLVFERPETYASVNQGVKHLRSRRFLGLFCSFLVFGRPRNLRERESRGQTFTLA